MAQHHHLGHLLDRVVLLRGREQATRTPVDSREVLRRQGDVLLLDLLPREAGRRMEGVLRPEQGLLLAFGEEGRDEWHGVRHGAADDVALGPLEVFALGSPGNCVTVRVRAVRTRHVEGARERQLPAPLDEPLLLEALEHLVPHRERDARGSQEAVGGEVDISVRDHHVARQGVRDVVPHVLERRLVRLRVEVVRSLDGLLADRELVLEPQADRVGDEPGHGGRGLDGD